MSSFPMGDTDILDIKQLRPLLARAGAVVKSLQICESFMYFITVNCISQNDKSVGFIMYSIFMNYI